jgi:hypothetical protein
MDEQLERTTKQLLEHEQILTPKWRRTLELAHHEFREKEELLKAAQHGANEASKKKRGAEFAYDELGKRMKTLLEDKGEAETSGTLKRAKDKWNSMPSPPTFPSSFHPSLSPALHFSSPLI